MFVDAFTNGIVTTANSALMGIFHLFFLNMPLCGCHQACMAISEMFGKFINREMSEFILAVLPVVNRVFCCVYRSSRLITCRRTMVSTFTSRSSVACIRWKVSSSSAIRARYHNFVILHCWYESCGVKEPVYEARNIFLLGVVQ